MSSFSKLQIHSPKNGLLYMLPSLWQKNRGALSVHLAQQSQAPEWQSCPPDCPGVWWISCRDDAEPSLALVFIGMDGVWMVDAFDAGARAMNDLHDGLTEVQWAPVTGVTALPAHGGRFNFVAELSYIERLRLLAVELTEVQRLANTTKKRIKALQQCKSMQANMHSTIQISSGARKSKRGAK